MNDQQPHQIDVHVAATLMRHLITLAFLVGLFLGTILGAVLS